MKKAEVPAWVVGVAVFVLTLLVLLPIFNQVRAGVQEGEPAERCLRSVQAKSIAKDVATAEAIKLDCPRNRVIFEKESQSQVNSKILQRVKECSRAIGGGTVDFSSGGYVWSDNVCVICSTIDFIDDSKAQKGYSASSFDDYLERVPYNSDKTWKEYLQSSTASKHKGLIYNLPDSVDPDEKHIIFFKYTPASTYDWILNKLDDKKIKLAPVIFFEEFPKDNSEFKKCKVLN